MTNKSHEIQLQDKKVTIEFANLAEQTNGNALVRIGDTVVLLTAVMANSEREGQDWFPLTVDYEEKFYAAGKILGSRFVRREGRPSDEAIIAARLIDRAIRPLFPKGFKRDVQVIATCLSWDGEHDPDVISLIGASFVLSLSDIPWDGPLGAVRVGKVDGSFIINPTYEQRQQGDLDFVIAAIKQGDGLLYNMIEAESKEADEKAYEEALEFAKPYITQIIEDQETLVKNSGTEKLGFAPPTMTAEAQKETLGFIGDKFEKALFQGDKHQRMGAVEAIRKEVKTHIEESFPDDLRYLDDFLEDELDRLVHQAALERDARVDDRAPDEIRPLQGVVDVLPRTHGTGMFSRGQTRTLSILTLGGPGDHKLLEGMEIVGKKRFMHHYNFPPYAPGEVRPLRGAGRREIGHGMLAEKALLPVIPDIEEFPYTIRIVTECVSSNGSTSMASACSSTLALMDAGVPIKRPVAGISMGLMQDDKGNYKILTDIQGPEDHYGDMDFKVAGTKEGITAIQLDVKIKGITEKMFQETLAEAAKARYHILDEVITKTLPAPREKLSEWAPSILSLKINPDKIGAVIGGGGKTINKIIEIYGVDIDIEDSGDVFITGTDHEKANAAAEYIKDLTREVEVGEIFEGEVKRILDFGAFVEIGGGQDGLVHISQLAEGRVEKVEDVVNIGDIVTVKVIGIDDQGRINLSLKDAKKNNI